MPDRYGEKESPKCTDPECFSPGWHGYDADGRLIPCPVLKGHLLGPRPDDYTAPSPSARAQQAIDRDELENPI